MKGANLLNFTEILIHWIFFIVIFDLDILKKFWSVNVFGL